jgi:acetyl esterase/lipase
MIAAILLLALGVVAWVSTLNAIWPRQSLPLILVSWVGAWLAVELAPLILLFDVVVVTVLILAGALDHTVGWIGLGLIVARNLVAAPMIWRSSRTRISMRGFLDDLEPQEPTPRYPRSHILVPPLMFLPRGVRHQRGVVYQWIDDRPLKLDVYMPKTPSDSPRSAVVQVHGGGWVIGTRKEQGIPLLNHLAANGWVGFNIDYRLSPFATMPDHVVDVKRAIAWVREHAEEYGVDPSFIALTGGSAGGHLTALAALTSDDKSLQPGFEDADTSVQAAVPFYGVYDFTDDGTFKSSAVWQVLEWVVFKARRSQNPEAFRAASPTHRVHPGAPPIMVVAGEHDSLIPTGQHRAFAERLREVSRNPVLYAEMKGGQHAFDIFPSFRSVPVIETVERFLATIHARRDQAAPMVERELEAALTD